MDSVQYICFLLHIICWDCLFVYAFQISNISLLFWVYFFGLIIVKWEIGLSIFEMIIGDFFHLTILGLAPPLFDTMSLYSVWKRILIKYDVNWYINVVVLKCVLSIERYEIWIFHLYVRYKPKFFLVVCVTICFVKS